MTAGRSGNKRPTDFRGETARGVRRGDAIDIMLIDDHDIVRRGLRSLIESNSGWRVSCEAATGREALALLKTCHADVVVTDLGLPELNGLMLVRKIRRMVPAPEVVVFSMYETEFLVREVIAMGARGYVLKSDAARHLTEAIEAAVEGKPYVSPTIAVKIRDILADHADHQIGPGPAGRPLTFRQQEIIQLLAEGKSNKEIAIALSISVKTVETHRSAIMRNLGLNSIVDLVRYAVQNGITHF